LDYFDCTVIAVDAKEHMHRRQLLAGMIVSNIRSAVVCSCTLYYCYMVTWDYKS